MPDPLGEKGKLWNCSTVQPFSAGAILTGFCGTFLSFRLQREANYYRQVAVDFEHNEARDIYVGLTHFTGPLLLLLLSTIVAALFGFVFPLVALAEPASQIMFSVGIVAAGEVAALVLLFGYFVGELVHYQVLTTSLVNDAMEWGSQWPVVLLTVMLAAAVFFVVFKYVGVA